MSLKCPQVYWTQDRGTSGRWRPGWPGRHVRKFTQSVGLSSEIPLGPEVRTGASEVGLDLSQFRVTDLRLETGASSSDIILPERAGMTRASIKGGATSVKLHVPRGVAARITSNGGLAEFKVDTTPFPKTAGGYKSVEYATAENRVEVRTEVGLSSISIT